ncbi:hypothetical protein Rhal01_02287 [Rubritalea halochordaticola]|uniref:Cadherin domain-containing protein n=1 Tax=Rubritalea halochordaticola TaxID=714537 RepID=A0ABP9V092_9BACT
MINRTLLGAPLMAASIVMVGSSLIQAAPSTITQSVTYNGETITLQLTKENLRGSNFEVLVQNSSGTYDTYTAVDERSYIGSVDEYPGAIACGIQMDNGTFKGAVYFERGGTWFTEGSSVTSTRGMNYEDFTNFQYPSASSVTSGQAGSTTYGYDVGIDAEYNYYNGPGGGSTAKTFELIEYSVCLNRAMYMRDALLRPYLGRVIIRSDETQDPYYGLGGGTYLSTLRSHWNANHTSSNSDLVAGVCPSKVGGGLAYVGVVGGSSKYSVNDSGSNGHFDVIWRHEMGHNWSCSHYVGGSPEGAAIMGGNQPARFSGCEVYRMLSHRDSKISAGGILDNEGTYTSIDLPPYAALDPVSLQIEAGKVESVNIDVLANDFDANGHSISLDSFDSTSKLGYPVTVSVGTGANGQDELVYSAMGGSGFDYISYTIEDSSGQTAKGYVVINCEGVSPKLWELTADADSYVQVNSSTNYGSVDNMFLKYKGSGSSYTRTGWVHFDTSGKTYGEEATLEFTVDISSSAGLLDVWGIVDGAHGDELGTDWSESGINHGNSPANPDFSEGTQLTYLGSIDASSVASGSKCKLSNAALLAFLEADTNGEVTFLIQRENADANFSLRTKEHASGGAPSLSTSFPVGGFLGTDAYVRNGGYSNTNYGTEDIMAVKKDGSGYQRESYLRFDLTSLNDIGTGKVLLNLTALQTQSGQTYRIRLVDDSGDSWAEQGLTYNNRTVGSGTGVTFSASDITVNTPFSIDVTELFSQVSNNNGAATFHIDALTKISTGFTRIATREHATASYRPSITIIDQDPHDAYVRGGGSANSNFGSDTGLVLKNDSATYYREFFLRRAYDDNGGNPVAAATLTMTPVGVSGTRDVRIRLLDDADDTWKEGEVTYNNRPSATGSEVTFSGGAFSTNVPYTVDVTSLLNQSFNNNGVASFLVDLPGSTSQVYYTIASKEHATAAYRPVLNVNPNAPVASDSSSDVNSGSVIGATAASVGASDADSADTLSYAITAGNGSGLFAINASTGEITTTANVEVGQHVLTVSVTDSGVPALADTATITINVVTADSDSDGLDDGWEVATFGSTTLQTGGDDYDGDGLSNAAEVAAGTDVFTSDSDADGYSDGFEAAQGTDPGDILDAPTTLLVYLWEFNGTDFAGGSTVDTVGGLDADFVGGAALSADGTGFSGQTGDKALDLGNNGDGKYAEVTGVTALQLASQNDQLTISFWQKLDQTGVQMSSFWAYSPASGGDYRGLQAHTPWSNNNIYFDMGSAASSRRISCPTPSGTTWTQWNHIALVKDGGTAKIYVNGVLADTETGKSSLYTDYTKLILGANGTGGNSMDGLLDDFTIFNTALSSSQIGSLASGSDPASIQ